jgi:hypothetical protein
MRAWPGQVHRYAEAVTGVLLPTGEPLTGRWIRLDVLGEADLDELYPILSDPAVYAQGYTMHRRPRRWQMPATWHEQYSWQAKGKPTAMAEGEIWRMRAAYSPDLGYTAVD